MLKLKIRTGDRVIVLSGKDKGKEGEVLSVNREKNPDKNRAVVRGVNMIKKHTKPSADNPQGGIVEREAPIHISNLSLVDPKSGKATRVGYRIEEGKKVRYAKKSGEIL